MGILSQIAQREVGLEWVQLGQQVADARCVACLPRAQLVVFGLQAQQALALLKDVRL